ncbi:hypothetical protein [Amycolatopsis tolypomycina]|uniref:hypothetical protein n=1 Tax=Amycolatopsis tolypomycina TaxID=208445 RepID=UPI0033A054C2
MSFGIVAVGTVEQVRAQLDKRHQEITGFGGATNPQYEAARQLILAELDGWPTCADPKQEIGLHVEASGHHDAHNRNLSITIRPVWFPKVDQTKEGEPAERPPYFSADQG